MDHRTYLVVAIATHGVLGYALVRGLTRYPPALGGLGALGAVVPDVDLLFDPAWGFPLVHRGVTHTPAFLGIVVAGLLFVNSPKVLLVDAPEGTSVAFGTGFISHLVVDSFTPTGIMWFYPESARYLSLDAPRQLSLDVPIHSPAGTVALCSVAVGLLAWEWRSRRRRGRRATSD